MAPTGSRLIIWAPVTGIGIYLVYNYLDIKRKRLRAGPRNGYKNLFSESLHQSGKHHNSLMHQVLTPEIYSKLVMAENISNGFTLDKCIQVGVNDRNRRIGIVAGDEQSYEVYSEVFDKVIEHIHGSSSKGFVHPVNLGYSALEPEPDEQLDEKYVHSCRIRVARNIRGLSLPAAATNEERRKTESIIMEVLSSGFDGSYHSLSTNQDVNNSTQQEKAFLDKRKESLLVSAGMDGDWPNGRGIWYNKDKSLSVWVNEEDHMRIIATDNEANLQKLAFKFFNFLTEIDKRLEESGFEFQSSQKLGYITSCPSNLGTALRASVHIKLPNLSKEKNFGPILKSLGLQLRSTKGESYPISGDTYDVSNFNCFTENETKSIQTVIDGVKMLIEMEKLLSRGESIEETTSELLRDYNGISNTEEFYVHLFR